MGVIFSLSVVHVLFKPSTFAATPGDGRERGVWRRQDGPAPTRLAAEQEELKVVRQGQEETSQWLSVQSHNESYMYLFKKKGNGCQFNANQQVTDRLAVVASCLHWVVAIGTSGKEQLERTKREMVEGMSFLTRRQKAHQAGGSFRVRMGSC